MPAVPGPAAGGEAPGRGFPRSSTLLPPGGMQSPPAVRARGQGSASPPGRRSRRRTPGDMRQAPLDRPPEPPVPAVQGDLNVAGGLPWEDAEANRARCPNPLTRPGLFCPPPSNTHRATWKSGDARLELHAGKKIPTNSTEPGIDPSPAHARKTAPMDGRDSTAQVCSAPANELTLIVSIFDDCRRQERAAGIPLGSPARQGPRACGTGKSSAEYVTGHGNIWQ